MVMRRRGKRLRLLRWTGWTVAGIVMATVLFIPATAPFGWRFDLVVTGSMVSAFDVGGLVITRPVLSDDVAVGDPILFREKDAEAYICHRVIAIKEMNNELFFQTKGDANKYPDLDLVSSPVSEVIFYVPHVGKVASYLNQTPITFMGKKLSVTILLVLVLALTAVGIELKNIWEWTFSRELKRHQEVLKKRREKALKRRYRFV